MLRALTFLGKIWLHAFLDMMLLCLEFLFLPWIFCISYWRDNGLHDQINKYKWNLID